MLNRDQVVLLHIQFGILDSILRGIVYSRILRARYPESVAHRFIATALTQHVVIAWCTIFGTDSEATHWKKFGGVGPAVAPFSRDDILKAASLSESQWSEYWTQMTGLRNEFFAHFDMKSMEAR